MTTQAVLPAPGALPLLGHMPVFAGNPLRFFRKNEKLNAPAYRLVSPVRPIVVVNHPQLVGEVLQEQHRKFEKSFGYDALKPLLGNGLLTSDGAYWLRHRRQVQPAFHKQKLEALGQAMIETIDRELETWPKEIPDLYFLMNRLALKIVSVALFGSDVTERQVTEINEALGIAVERGADRIRKPWMAPRWIPTLGNVKEQRALDTLFANINGLIRQRKNSGERRDDLLDMLLYAGGEASESSGWTEEEIREEVMTIFIAGHETTANTLSFALAELAKQPEWVNRLAEEAQIWEQAETPMQRFRQLEAAGQVIDESLRLYPPAWVLGRAAQEDVQTELATIPKGYTVVLPIVALQRSAKYWNNPLDFDPHRFAAENAFEKWAYLPFGGGPRLCIGQQFALMEARFALSKMMQGRRLSIHLPKGFHMQPLISLRPGGELSGQWKG